VPSGGEEKNLNMGAQLQIIPYKKPPKFLKIAQLNSISVRTNAGTVFGTISTNLTVFVPPYIEVAKYFYTGAHLQYIG